MSTEERVVLESGEQTITKLIQPNGRIKFEVLINGKNKKIDRLSQIKQLKSEGHLSNVDIELFNFKSEKMLKRKTESVSNDLSSNHNESQATTSSESISVTNVEDRSTTDEPTCSKKLNFQIKKRQKTLSNLTKPQRGIILPIRLNFNFALAQSGQKICIMGYIDDSIKSGFNFLI